MKRTGQAHWQGNLKAGKGTLSTQSKVLSNTEYSFKSRFGEGVTGTNPEELLAAAHAGCFTLSVASILTQKGITPISLDTVASVTLEGTTITGVHLSITGSVPEINQEIFTEVTKEAEINCIISKVLSIPISSEAHLEVSKHTNMPV